MLSYIALFALVLAIAIGIKMRLNIGIVGIGIAFILGTANQVKDVEIIAGFGTSLFVMLFGVMYMFGIAQVNGTIELLAKKIIFFTGKRANLIPISLFFVGAFVAGIGPGTVPTILILSMFSIALAKELGMNPAMMGAMALYGAETGGLSPIAATGIIRNDLSANIDVFNVNFDFAIATLIATFVSSMIIYVMCKGYSVKTSVDVENYTLAPFNKVQKLTLAGMVMLVLIVLVFNVNVGLTAFAIGLVLLSLGCASEKETMGTIAWGTIILVCGMGVLMGVIAKLGGITLLANILATLMAPSIETSVMTVAAGVLSYFSSASGVVMPTLIPTIPDILTNISGSTTPVELISAVIAGAHIGGLSPLTGGALILSAYSTIYQASTEEVQKMYLTLFKMAVICTVAGAVLAFVGVYKI